ncbi:6-bladed beta-propeller [Parabacteroides sp. OttesenSCG-928-G06]|nr:6-bladed beta-propeller [Parabacteroides sp. OttesenSCG-928-K15]MDL2281676.1 6-bladed beta-propeller [Parabacteroides sp. OttesenSCG-928-G06]
MITVEKAVLYLSVGVVLCACNTTENKKSVYWENAPVVAERVAMEHGELIDFKPELLKDTIVLPLSYFIEEPQVVKLEDSDEALISSMQSVVMSDNYFLIVTGNTVPCKLFDKKGKFIATIGSIGGGPGEYNHVGFCRIDEKEEKIYLFSSNTELINIYDFSGAAIGVINLPRKIGSCYFQFEGDKVHVVTQPSGSRQPLANAWTQDREGVLLDSIPAPQLILPSGLWGMQFIAEERENPSVYFMTYPEGRVDSLYHVDFKEKRFIPRFTMDMNTLPKYAHLMREWPDHFVGSTSEEVSVVYYTEDGGTDRKMYGDKAKYYIVDKETLKGGYLRIEDDFYMGLKKGAPISMFSQGVLVRNVDPGNLAETLEKSLAISDLPEKLRTKLQATYDSIGEDDNNYIIYAKMK